MFINVNDNTDLWYLSNNGIAVKTGSLPHCYLVSILLMLVGHEDQAWKIRYVSGYNANRQTLHQFVIHFHI